VTFLKLCAFYRIKLYLFLFRQFTFNSQFIFVIKKIRFHYPLCRMVYRCLVTFLSLHSSQVHLAACFTLYKCNAVICICITHCVKRSCVYTYVIYSYNSCYILLFGVNKVPAQRIGDYLIYMNKYLTECFFIVFKLLKKNVIC